MSKELIIVVRAVAKADKIELVKNSMLKLIEPTRKEAGCLQYDLSQDNENPAVFIFYEVWESRTLWQTHMNNDNLKVHMKETEGAIENITINEMSKVD